MPERGELAGEDDDGGRADRGEEAFGGLPVLDVPELERAQGGRGAARVEDFARGELAVEVGDLEVELAPAVDLRENDVEDGDELFAEEKVLAVGLCFFGASVDVDIEG